MEPNKKKYIKDLVSDVRARQCIEVILTTLSGDMVDAAMDGLMRSLLIVRSFDLHEEKGGRLKELFKEYSDQKGLTREDFKIGLIRIGDMIKREVQKLKSVPGYVAKCGKAPSGHGKDSTGRFVSKAQADEPRYCFKQYQGQWKSPTEPRLKTISNLLHDERFVRNIREAFVRKVEHRGRRHENEHLHGIETPGRMYSMLIPDALKAVCGHSFGDCNLVLSRNDINRLQDPTKWLQERTEDDTFTSTDKKATIEAKNKLLKLAVEAFIELDIIKNVKDFAKRQSGIGQEDSVVLTEMFARYYTTSKEEASLGLPTAIICDAEVDMDSQVYVTQTSRSYPVHYDTRNYTVVLTLPTSNYTDESGMMLRIYDPNGKAASKWRDGVVVGPESLALANQSTNQAFRLCHYGKSITT